MALYGLSIAQQQLTTSAGVGLILASVVVVLSKARLSEGVRNPGPLWSHFAFQIPVYVCSTLIAVAFFDVRKLWIFAHVSDADFYDASLWLIYGVVAYCLFFLIFDRLFVERTRR